MKNTFTIFYSWQMSTPEEDNKKRIFNCLNDAVAKFKKGGFEILIDQDSRNSTRENSIDYIILQKIPNCDFFVGDITPIITDDKNKLIPNPNVMLELGYAVKAIGWARCLLIWNEKYGDKSYAPFDVRNRSIIHYNSLDNKDIDFYSILKNKIEQYDQIISKQKNDDIDYNVYMYWNNMISPQKLRDLVDRIITNCAYMEKDFDLLDDFQESFSKNVGNHYKNNLLENSRKELNNSVRALCVYLAGSEFDRVNKNYWKMNDKYTKHNPVKEYEIINQVFRLGSDVIEKNKQYYEALQSVFGYLG